MMIVLLRMLTQKKRLAGKLPDRTREKKKLCIRCCVLIPLLVLMLLLPMLC